MRHECSILVGIILTVPPPMIMITVICRPCHCNPWYGRFRPCKNSKTTSSQSSALHNATTTTRYHQHHRRRPRFLHCCSNQQKLRWIHTCLDRNKIRYGFYSKKNCFQILPTSFVSVDNKIATSITVMIINKTMPPRTWNLTNWHTDCLFGGTSSFLSSVL